LPGYDVIVIGAGIVGTMIARELSTEGLIRLDRKGTVPLLWRFQSRTLSDPSSDFCPPVPERKTLRDAPSRFKA
jgi:cation diffusion facilitator CzcD-associated flavoprotein CzcO